MEQSARGCPFLGAYDFFFSSSSSSFSFFLDLDSERLGASAPRSSLVIHVDTHIEYMNQ